MTKTHKFTKRLPLLSLVLAGSLVSGCISVLPEPNQPQALVRLPVENIRGASTPLLTNVVVHTPDAMGAIAGVEIAASENQRIRYINNVVWADTPANLFQAAVVDALTASSGDGQAVPVQVGARGDYDLRLSLLDLTVDSIRNEAVCEIRLVMTRAGDKAIITSHILRTTQAIDRNGSMERAETLAHAIRSAAELTADFVAENAIPYDLEAEREAHRIKRRLQRERAQKEVDKDTSPVMPRDKPSDLPPEFKMETDV
ncbi:ABC-type transport auxiliary lipoprotein family protein [Hirschia litorea]|uniref:ABC-type transport auxiliary lipoprotein component domain-containing protein n=1 Tax=Hirschia litorea TaxID=1199156 RepID=A0ABW2ILM9_9PROT